MTIVLTTLDGPGLVPQVRKKNIIYFQLLLISHFVCKVIDTATRLLLDVTDLLLGL